MAKKPTLSDRIAASNQKALDQRLAPPKSHNTPRRKPPLVWDGDSECFSDLRYSPSAGGVYATFARDGSQYFYPMSRAEARDWFNDDVGRVFNSEIR